MTRKLFKRKKDQKKNVFNRPDLNPQPKGGKTRMLPTAPCMYRLRNIYFFVKYNGSKNVFN